MSKLLHTSFMCLFSWWSIVEMVLLTGRRGRPWFLKSATSWERYESDILSRQVLKTSVLYPDVFSCSRGHFVTEIWNVWENWRLTKMVWIKINFINKYNKKRFKNLEPSGCRCSRINHCKMMLAAVTRKKLFCLFVHEKCRKIINTALIFIIVCFYDRKQNRFHGIKVWMILWILSPDSRVGSRNVQ